MPPGAPENVQSAFLNQVKSRLPEHISFVDELAELLGISRDSAYRRIRGETVLSLDEVKKLYDRFGTSVDATLSSSSNMVLFHHRALTNEYSVDRWLNSVIKNLALENEFENKEIIYAAKDIPIFHYFRYPELSAFKIFFWHKTLMRDSAYQSKSFDFSSVPNDLLTLGSKVWKLYSTIPSIEIWSDEAINDTVKQITFYSDCGFFAKLDVALALIDGLQALVNSVKEQAAQGCKNQGATFRLYENAVWIADNTVFAKMGNKRVVYVNYNTLNLLTTLQSSFCEKTEAYLEKLIRNSTLISSSAEKERNKFFNKMNQVIDRARAQLSL